jgi:20S proteasome alpha/beta subunit
MHEAHHDGPFPAVNGIPHLAYARRATEREESEMTFTYAVIADGGIVLCADSQVTHTHQDGSKVIGTYEGRRGKIRRLGNRFAFSMAGNGGLIDTLLAQVGERDAEGLSFDEVVFRYWMAFREYCHDKHPLPDAAFLFCGYAKGRGEERIPQIVKLDVRNEFGWEPIAVQGYAATGAAEHGAAYYLHHRLYRDGMPLEQAKLLAYCAAAEVADLDNSVGGPIEMEIITPDGSRRASHSELEKYEKARQELIARVRSFLAAFQ